MRAGTLALRGSPRAERAEVGLSYAAVLALTAGLAAGALLLVLRRPEVVVHVVLFVLYTNLAVVATGGGRAANVLMAALLGALAIPLVNHLVLRQEELRTGPVFWLMLVFLGIFAVSAARAIDGGVAFERIALFIVEGLAVYLLVINVVRTLPTLRRVTWTLLASGGLLGGLALYQAVTSTYDAEFAGLAQSSFAIELSEAPATADLEAGAEGTASVPRAGGPVDEPNRFAQMLLVLLPLALFQLRYGGSGAARGLALGAGALVLSGVALTYSRGAFLTLAILVALCAALGYVRPSRIVVGVMILLLLTPWIAPGYYERMGSIGEALEVLDRPSRTDAEGVARGRTTETLAAFHAFLDHPALGVGPGHYLPHYSVRYQLDPDISMRYLPEPRRAHNLYAEIAAETGLAGLVVFLSMPLVLLRTLWVRRRTWLREMPELASLATAFGLAILAYLGTGVFLHLAFERYYWLLLALAAATCSILSPRYEPVQAGRPMA